jgi:hypothetical protein
MQALDINVSFIYSILYIIWREKYSMISGNLSYFWGNNVYGDILLHQNENEEAYFLVSVFYKNIIII